MQTTRKLEANSQSQIPEYFLSLGAGRNQLDLINAARQLGYQVIAVDRNTKAPGFDQANLRMYCSILRPKKILRNLNENFLFEGKLAGVGCRSYGRANFSSAIIANHFSLPGPRSSSLGVFQDKAKLKKLLKKLGIPTATSYMFKKGQTNKKADGSELQNYLPLVVRPIKGHAKQGVRLLEQVEDIRNFLANHSNIGDFLLDRYIEGKEITVLGFISQGHFQIACITDKHVAKYSSSFLELQHHYPTKIDTKLEEKITGYIQQICEATCIDDSPIVAEFLVCQYDDDMPLYLIECSPEVGGEYLAEQLMPAALCVNYFQDLIHVYTGKGINMGETSYGQPSAQVNIRFISQRDGCLKRIEFPKSLWEHQGFLFAHYLKKPDETTSIQRGNLDRLAVFGLKAPLDSQQLYQDVERIVHDTKIEYH